MVLLREVDESCRPVIVCRERWVVIEPSESGSWIRLPTLAPAPRPVDGHARSVFAGRILVLALVRQNSIQIETVVEAGFGERWSKGRADPLLRALSASHLDKRYSKIHAGAVFENRLANRDRAPKWQLCLDAKAKSFRDEMRKLGSAILL
jgi:hypothetical protein